MTRTIVFDVLFWSALMWAPPILAIAFTNPWWLLLWVVVGFAFLFEALVE
ncbi:MAG: hypothetical protein ACLGSH_01785 [Acidobacteriota bacterium]